MAITQKVAVVLSGPFRKSVNVFMDAASAWLGIVTHRAPLLDDSVPFRTTPGRAGSGVPLLAPLKPHRLISGRSPATRTAPTSHPRLPASVIPPSSHRYLTVVPLISYQRYYGEVTEVCGRYHGGVGCRRAPGTGGQPIR